MSRRPPAALQATVEIADRCKFRLPLAAKRLADECTQRLGPGLNPARSGTQAGYKLGATGRIWSGRCCQGIKPSVLEFPTASCIFCCGELMRRRASWSRHVPIWFPQSSIRYNGTINDVLLLLRQIQILSQTDEIALRLQDQQLLWVFRLVERTSDA